MDWYEKVKWCFVYASAIIIPVSFFWFLIKRKLPALLRWAIAGIALGTILLTDMYIIEPNWIEIEEVIIHDKKLSELLAGIRIVHISDIHARKTIGFRERQLIRKVNSLNADIIFITGDFISDFGGLRSALEIVSKLKAKIGKFGVMGNHDHYRVRPDFFAREFREAGIDILLNEHRLIPLPNGRTLTLAGVDDPVTGHANIARTLDSIRPGEPVIMLAHTPSFYPQAHKRHINLLLAGHSHGGQIGIPYFVHEMKGDTPSMYLRGLIQEGSTQMYVNRGIGMTNKPIRFLCRPEITLLEVSP